MGLWLSLKCFSQACCLSVEGLPQDQVSSRPFLKMSSPHFSCLLPKLPLTSPSLGTTRTESQDQHSAIEKNFIGKKGPLLVPSRPWLKGLPALNSTFGHLKAKSLPTP